MKTRVPPRKSASLFSSPVSRAVAFSLLALIFGPGDAGATLVPDIRNVPVPVEVSGLTVSVRIPAGAASCVLEVKQANSQRWFRWRTLLPAGRPMLGSTVFPKTLQGAEWRATASVSGQRAAAFRTNNKFPEAYYQGNTRFSRTPAAGHAPGYVASVPVSSGVLGNAVVSQVADRLALPQVTAVNSFPTIQAKATATPATQAVEADIWKARGNTVFFFNQLRGLQVLDLADPAAPRMQASLRLPAVGQDLYVLPGGDPSEALVVLLACSPGGQQAGTEVLTVRVSGSSAHVVSSTPLAGWLSDSRMVGDRLYVLTSNWSAAGPGTVLQEVQFLADGTQATPRNFPLPAAGGGGLISAGSDWMAVAYSNTLDWSRSNVALFTLSPAGAALETPTPIRTAGQIHDKFKLSKEGDTVTAVSQRYDAPANGPLWMSEPVTLVENFNSKGAAVSTALEVIRGENLYASRFVPGKLYLVTAVQSDPLWVVDLKDPALPKVTGHVEVPGFSTYIEPVGEDGNFLFTIGLEEGKVAASLFDVSDVTKPALKSRVYVSEPWAGFSEAVWDEKALKVLPEDGLVLVPFSGWRQGVQNGEKSSFVRLLDMNLLDGGSLALRGRLDHAFSPRRAMLLNGVLTSISQKELLTANIADRDRPALLAAVGLAWPVNQVLRQDQYLLQIGDGSNAGWTGEAASLLLTKVESPDSILSEVELGEGSVQDAALKSGKLYVLRKKWGSPQEPLPYQILGSSVVPRRAAASELVLDVFDASTLPNLRLLGSATSKADPGTVTAKIGSLLWISDTLVGVVSQPRVWSFGWEAPVLNGVDVLRAVRNSLAGPGAVSPSTGATVRTTVVDALPYFPRPRSERSQPAVVRAFDVSNPAAPVALSPLTLTGTQSMMLTATAAGDGLLVYGYGEAPAVWKNGKWPQDREQPVTCTHRLGVADFANPTAPVLRTPVVLPGRLFAATEVSRTGLLAFTESVSAATVNDAPLREVKVSAVSHPLVTEFATKKVGLRAFLAAEGRSLFVTEESVARRAVLNDLGLWLEGESLPLPFQPADIAVKDQELLGVSGDRLVRASWKATSVGVDQWQGRIWVPAHRLTLGEDRSVFAPQGDFGVQEYVPAPPSIFPLGGTPSLLLVGSSGVNVGTQVLVRDGTGQTNTGGAILIGNNTYSGTSPVTGTLGLTELTAGTLSLVSGTVRIVTGGTLSLVTGGTLSLEGQNVGTQVLISGGTIQTNQEGLSLTVTGITLSQGTSTAVLVNSGSISLTGGTVSTTSDKPNEPAPTGVAP